MNSCFNCLLPVPFGTGFAFDLKEKPLDYEMDVFPKELQPEVLKQIGQGYKVACDACMEDK